MEQIDSTQQPANNDDGGEEMTFEQFLVYSARCGDIDEVKEMLDVKDPPVDLNYQDPSMS